MELQTQNQQSDLLKQVAQGNAMAAMAMQELVQERCLRPNQLPRVFYTATMSAAALREKIRPFESYIMKKSKKGKESQVREVILLSYRRLEERRRETHKLASHTMFEMLRLSPYFVDDIHGDLLHVLKNPYDVSAEYLRMLSLCEMVLIGKELVVENRIIELAEAITEGLTKIHNQKEISEMLGDGREENEKIKEMLKLGKAVRERLPNEVDRIYQNLFAFALYPKCSADSPCRATLLASLRKVKNGELQVDEVVERRLYRTFGLEPKKREEEKLTFWRRMGTKAKEMLGPFKRKKDPEQPQTVYVDPSLLSDGDMNLSKGFISRAKRALTYPIRAVRSKTRKKLAYAQGN